MVTQTVIHAAQEPRRGTETEQVAHIAQCRVQSDGSDKPPQPGPGIRGGGTEESTQHRNHQRKGGPFDDSGQGHESDRGPDRPGVLGPQDS